MQFAVVTSPVNKMKPIQIAIILSGLSHAYPRYSYLPIYSNQCECKGYNKNSRSIIVKDTMWVFNLLICIQRLYTFSFRGNLGNKMFTYSLLYLFKLKYGYDIYVTKVVHDHLKSVFKNLGNFRRVPNIYFKHVITHVMNFTFVSL